MANLRLKSTKRQTLVPVLVLLSFLIAVSNVGAEDENEIVKTNVISTFHDGVASLLDHRRRQEQKIAQDDQLAHAFLAEMMPRYEPRAGMDLQAILKLMDLFKKLNVKPTENSTRCEWDFYRLGQALTSQQMWAFSMIDAFGKPSSGILNGNFRWPGSFSQCRSIVSQDNTTHYGSPFGGLYCTLDTAFSKNLSQIAAFGVAGVSIGVCVPDTCTDNEVMAHINETGLLPLIESYITLSKVTCRPPRKPFWEDTKALIPFIIIIILLLLMTAGTILDLHKRRYFLPLLPFLYDSSQSSHSISNLSIAVDNVKENDDSAHGSTQTIITTKEESDDPFATAGTAGRLLLAFSVYTNGAKLLNPSPGKGSLPVLNGIRVFSITWVILGHTYSLGITQMDNMVVFAGTISEFTMQTVLQGGVSVDSFFVLSGLLMTYLYLKEHERTGGSISWIKFYVHRYCRLTPTYLLVMFLISNGLWSYWSDGPFWPSAGFEGDKCYKSWWWNILYINNFQDSTEQCMAHTWYLANDMQFYVISPIFLLALTRSVPLAGGLGSIFLLASWTATGIIGMQVHNPVNFDVTTLSGDTYMKYFNWIYTKPYCRIGPYIVGMACGWLLFKTKCNYKMRKEWVILGWALATACNLSVIYGLYHAHPTDEVSSLYYALARTGWGVGLAWVIFACCNGYGGIVTGILNLRIWNPLSRLTYCTYLWHYAFLNFVIFEPEVLDHFEPGFHMVYKYAANVLFSYLGAFFVSLAFESPIMTIEKVILKR